MKDYYDEYVALMDQKIKSDDEIISLKKKVSEQTNEILSLNKQLREQHLLRAAESSAKVTRSKSPVKKSEAAANDELVPWNVVFKKSHPGQLSYMNKAQKEKITEAVKEYLIEKKGSDEGCYQVNSKNQNNEICIPKHLIDPFHDWFDDKMDEGLLDGNKEPAPKRSTHATNSIKELAPAKEIVINFIPGNEFASTLIEIAETEYPEVIISLYKFTNLIESFCPSRN
jgi:hypothetical protein